MLEAALKAILLVLYLLTLFSVDFMMIVLKRSNSKSEVLIFTFIYLILLLVKLVIWKKNRHVFKPLALTLIFFCFNFLAFTFKNIVFVFGLYLNQLNKLFQLINPFLLLNIYPVSFLVVNLSSHTVLRKKLSFIFSSSVEAKFSRTNACFTIIGIVYLCFFTSRLFYIEEERKHEIFSYLFLNEPNFNIVKINTILYNKQAITPKKDFSVKNKESNIKSKVKREVVLYIIINHKKDENEIVVDNFHIKLFQPESFNLKEIERIRKDPFLFSFFEKKKKAVVIFYPDALRKDTRTHLQLKLFVLLLTIFTTYRIAKMIKEGLADILAKIQRELDTLFLKFSNLFFEKQINKKRNSLSLNISVKTEEAENQSETYIEQKIAGQVIENLHKIVFLLRACLGQPGLEFLKRRMAKGTFDYESYNGPVLFCDVRNFTELSERLQEHVFVVLNQIAIVVHRNVEKYGGKVSKNVGDAFVAVWNGSEFVNEALFSALSVLMEAKMNPVLEEHNIELGIGLTVGQFHTIMLGGQHKIDTVHIGAVLEEAEKSEGLCKKFGVPLIVSKKIFDFSCKSLKKYLRKIEDNVYTHWGFSKLKKEFYEEFPVERKIYGENPFLTKYRKLPNKFIREEWDKCISEPERIKKFKNYFINDNIIDYIK